METIERLILRLVDLIEERGERPIKEVAVAPPQGDLLPLVVATGIYPSAGRTMLDIPILPSASGIASSSQKSFAPPKVVEGFNIEYHKGKVRVSSGKYEINGEVREVEGVELDAQPYSIVVIDTQSNKISIEFFRLPQHIVLGIVTPEGVEAL